MSKESSKARCVAPGSGATDAAEAVHIQNVLYTAHTFQESADKFGVPPDQVQVALDSCLARLKEYRDKHRPRPHLDDKILTCWNGLMVRNPVLQKRIDTEGNIRSQISGLSKASEVLEGHAQSVLKLAEEAAAFIKKTLYNDDTGELRRSYREGLGPTGQADDYAFLIQGA